MRSAALLVVVLAAVAAAAPFHLTQGTFKLGTSVTNRLLDAQDSHAGRRSLGDVPKQWFTQKLDHFNTFDETTWLQKYYVNQTFWGGPGYPIFFMIGGEGPIDDRYVTAMDYVIYARTYKALMVTLEHRFYGESVPTADYSVANLRFLTSQQALADAANFAANITLQFNAPTSSWVTFGGSYPGCLSAWARLKYPNLFQGSISTSGPVHAELNFVQYLEVVQASLEYFGGTTCSSLITQATNKIQTLLQQPGGLSSVGKLFSVCVPLNSQDDVANFMSTLAGNVMGVVQYNNEGRGGPTITDVCATMLSNSDPLQAYVNLNQLFLASGNVTCLDVAYKPMIQQLQDTAPGADVGGRSWLWQTCQEFGFYQTTDSTFSHVFGNLFPLSFSLQMCNDVFGTNYQQADFQKRLNWTNDYYGSLDFSGSNTFFIHGSIDPWHALGIYQITSPVNSATLITGTAHCANMRMPLPSDPPQLVAARLQTSETIGKFL